MPPAPSAAELVLKVRVPFDNEAALMKPGARAGRHAQSLRRGRAAAPGRRPASPRFALEAAPRTTRAQSMDVLSSQANIAGYKAVMIAADKYQRFFPMLMTAAGTVKAARVVILGVGVAGPAGHRHRQAPGRRDRGQRRAPERQGAGRVAGRQVHRRALRDRRGEGSRGRRRRLCAAHAAKLAGPPEGRGGQARGGGRHRDHHRADPRPRRAGAGDRGHGARR